MTSQKPDLNTLATVNDRSISVQQALRFSILHDSSFLQDTIDGLLVRQYAEQNNISNSDEELQVAADEMRYQRGLESVDKLNQWLTSNNVTLWSVQEGLDLMILTHKTRNSIPESDIEAYFAEHQLEYDSVDLYSIRVDSEDKARELYSQITEDGENFHVLAMEHSSDEGTRHLGGYAGRLTRSQVTGEIEAAVFKAQAGEVIGPIKTEKGYNLLKVSAVNKASLEGSKDQVRAQIFADLIARQRAEARITYPVIAE